MEFKISPLSLIFVWHPSDNDIVKPILEHCSSLLSRDINNPFSRSMNLPIFYYTTCKKGIPNKINIDSQKKMIFAFVSKNIVSDSEWRSYIQDLYTIEGSKVISIAIDYFAFKIGGSTGTENFIRLYELSSYINERMFISITHELYRYALNEEFTEMKTGNDNALKLFISHAKDGKNGIALAKKLKEFIDNTPMRNFFDATDIAPGYVFNAEIMNHIKGSSVIAIRSDIYSSRYWCQKEVLAAKQNNRPIIAVDIIEKFDDRNFPFASNIPEIRVECNTIKEEELLRILSTILLETVRFFYSNKLLNYYYGDLKDTIICSRPPEVSDIEKLLTRIGDTVKINYKSVIYPEPPVYSEEVEFINNLGINTNTPLTLELNNLRDMYIGISISNISEEQLINIGQDETHLIKLSQDMSRHMLSRNATLIYGGDLRTNGFTEFLLNEAQVLKTRLNTDDIHLKNYISWPIYIKDIDEMIEWNAKYCDVAETIKVEYPDDVIDLIIDKDTFISPINIQNLYVWSRCLTEMRKQMIRKCNIRICAGGRFSGYKGRMPGILEEVLIAIEQKCPIFLLGGFGGITSSICNIIQYKTIPDELKLEWQINNNAGYKQLLELYENRKKKLSVNYDSISEILRNVELNNGLNEEENYRLFNTKFIDEAIYLVLKGLKNM